jgi:hypothetical protein
MPKAVKSTKQRKGSKKTLWPALIGGLVLLLAIIIYTFQLYPHIIPVGASWGAAPCIGQSPFFCVAPVLTNQGTLTITFAQASGATFYNTEVACLSNTSSSSPDSAAYTPLINTTLESGQLIQVTVSDLPCYEQTGKLGTIPIGTGFHGFLYVNYTSSSGVPSAENPWNTAKVGTFYVKVS